MAGFNPAEMRAANGTWSQQKQAANARANSPHQRLLREKLALEAEAKHLRAEIARAKVGVHRGKAGKHAGPKGTKSKGGAAGGASHRVKGGKAPHQSLAQQVAALKKTVAKLRVEWAKLQRRHRK